MKHIWKRRIKYNYYDTYETWQDAQKTAKWYKRKLNNKYIIIQAETGFLFPETKYRLYMSKVARLF